MHHTRAIVMVAVVASALVAAAQQSTDSAAVLQRTTNRLLADVERMPRYTCVQTITRTYYDARPRFHGPSCSALIEAHVARKHAPPTLGWDRLRLEVALVQGNTVFSWVGAPRFVDDTVDKLAGNGPLGSGDFGVFINDILRRATLDFQREQVIDSKRLLEYSYDMPIGKSTYRVKIEEGWALTAYDGTLLLDPEAADLVKLTVRTAELPTSSTACQATTEIMYGRTPIHDRLVLVPHETRLSTISRTGIETISQTNFANCREYTSTVRLILDTPQSTAVPSAMPSATAELPAPVPAGLRFDARIVTPIDSDTAAAGDPVEAVLRSSLHGKNKTVVAPAGSRMHGRLTNVSWQPGRVWNYKITVRFDSLEMGGRSVPFSAILEPPHPAVFTGTTISRTMLAQPEAGSPGGTFFFHQEHLRLEQLDASWVTLAPDTVMEKK